MFIYSPKYYADLHGHIFPIKKYQLLYKRLCAEAELPENLFAEPVLATEKQLLLVHSTDYLHDLKGYHHTSRTYPSELPLTKEIVDALILNSGGSIVAAREALREGGPGVAMNIGGGFHHAFPDHAEGFCYLNDVGITVRSLIEEALVKKVAIIDLDLHQGNGTAAIFQREPDAFTFSMHQEHLYPKKEQSDWDIGLDTGVGNDQYLQLLIDAVPKVLNRTAPDLVVYLAGADPYEDDRLGSLMLSIEGLRERDRIVYQTCRRKNVPVVTLLAGGYAERIEDTVEIHFNTCLEMLGYSDIDLEGTLDREK